MDPWDAIERQLRLMIWLVAIIIILALTCLLLL
jgi:hypothetical protein